MTTSQPRSPYAPDPVRQAKVMAGPYRTISQPRSPYAPDPVRQAKVMAGPYRPACSVCRR